MILLFLVRAILKYYYGMSWLGGLVNWANLHLVQVKCQLVPSPWSSMNMFQKKSKKGPVKCVKRDDSDEVIEVLISSYLLHVLQQEYCLQRWQGGESVRVSSIAQACGFLAKSLINEVICKYHDVNNFSRQSLAAVNAWPSEHLLSSVIPGERSIVIVQ